jgi:uncharacterized membrane protein
MLPEVTDQESLRLERHIATFLRVGVIAAGVLLLIGWLLDIQFDKNPFLRFNLYAPLPFVEGFKLALQSRAWGLVFSYVGLVALISLPVIRVLMTALVFFKQRDYILSGIAVFVLIALIGSMLLGIEL